MIKAMTMAEMTAAAGAETTVEMTTGMTINTGE
jgi:hypothetical protein